MLLIFDMLISLLERAFLTAHSDNMTPAQRRRWNSWEDFMREWLQRDAFFYRLPHLLKGEDPEFAAYFQRLAHEVRGIELPRQSLIIVTHPDFPARTRPSERTLSSPGRGSIRFAPRQRACASLT